MLGKAKLCPSGSEPKVRWDAQILQSGVVSLFRWRLHEFRRFGFGLPNFRAEPCTQRFMLKVDAPRYLLVHRVKAEQLRIIELLVAILHKLIPHLAVKLIPFQA